MASSDKTPLERLEAAVQEGTPGPWTAEPRGWADKSTTIRCGNDDFNGFSHHDEANAAKIVALVNAAPALLRVARAAQEYLEAAGSSNPPREAYGEPEGIEVALRLDAAQEELGFALAVLNSEEPK